MIPTTKTCGTCKHFPNDKHCVGCVWNEDNQENTKWELAENPIVIERAVLDKIRAEIEKPLRDERCFDTADAKAQYIALNWCIEIIDKYRAESEDIGDYPNEIPNQFDNLTGSMNL